MDGEHFPTFLGVLAACALSSCTPDLPHWDGSGWRVASTPADKASGVDRQARVTVELERLPFPNTVSPSTVSLKSGVIGASYEIRFQPVLRELWLELQAPLQPGVSYTLDVTGVSDLDGDTLPNPYHARFETSTRPGNADVPPAVDIRTVLALLAKHCAQSGCHSGSDPASGVDLAKGSGIEATAKNMASQTYNGTTEGDLGRGTLYLASPLIIESTASRGSPERSYLIYKLLGDEHILGDPMPPPGYAALTQDEIQMLSDWIYLGAKTR